MQRVAVPLPAGTHTSYGGFRRFGARPSARSRHPSAIVTVVIEFAQSTCFGSGFGVIELIFLVIVLGAGGFLLYRAQYWAAVALFVAAMVVAVLLVTR